jgi:hypothetical protein
MSLSLVGTIINVASLIYKSKKNKHMANVHEWLKDPNRKYMDGARILNAHSPKEAEFFLKVNNPDPSSYHFRMLISKLQNVARKIVQKVPGKEESAVKKVISVNDLKKPDAPKADVKKRASAVKNSAPKKEEGSVRIMDNPTVEFKELPENMQAKYLQNKELSKKISLSHTQLKSPNISDEERQDLLSQIEEYHKSQKENWTEIDEWWKANKNQPVVDPAQIAADAAVKKVKRIEALKINISRTNKDLLKDPQQKKAKEKADKIVIWQKELDDLQRK